ncbi:sugar phosphate isomerase/epimerase family protein [Saccharomonospora xinjiangensis]|uniref:Sugar phosphate isomerase/epimerase n=1 Tax=Saccharomonospora xinjiangensis XJ-54 TaxID=882086 RepID=I0UYP2_9PSEU|nr:sugar phosphate isomerase/epimerase family protein [Saccharomonospora xinjiangensis]EID52995.1 sugar phosphate isomerase/epimerase [Saccharomonospora xinjiangensis XJ-54]
MHPIGVNTWVWTSPLDGKGLRELVPAIASAGFDVAELPVENLGDWDPAEAAELLADHGLGASLVLVMSEGRELVRADAATVAATQDYLRRCLDIAASLGAPALAGPAYTSVGRTWRMTERERAECVREWRDNIGPVVEHAADAGVVLAVEPLNRYETSLFNTVDQTLRAMDGLPGCGIALDLYHQNIEERDIASAIRSAHGRIAHVQVCANDRGTPGRDHFDWPHLLAAIADANYLGSLCIESFTSHNDSIATAASIWRPLATSQDALAVDGLAFLKEVMSQPLGS